MRVPRWVTVSTLVLVLALAVASAATVNRPSDGQRAVGASTVADDGFVAVDAALSGVPAVKVGLFFHVGYAVADLDAAMTRFTRTLGIQWQPLLEFSQPVRFEDGQVRLISFQIAFSEQGPPYIELVHATAPDGRTPYPWTATRRSSSAHFGYAVNDLPAASDALVAAGYRRIATVDAPGRSAAAFAYHRGPGGIIVELLDGAFVPPGMCDTPGSPFCPPGS